MSISDTFYEFKRAGGLYFTRAISVLKQSLKTLQLYVKKKTKTLVYHIIWTRLRE